MTSLLTALYIKGENIEFSREEAGKQRFASPPDRSYSFGWRDFLKNEKMRFLLFSEAAAEIALAVSDE